MSSNHTVLSGLLKRTSTSRRNPSALCKAAYSLVCCRAHRGLCQTTCLLGSRDSGRQSCSSGERQTQTWHHTCRPAPLQSPWHCVRSVGIGGQQLWGGGCMHVGCACVCSNAGSGGAVTVVTGSFLQHMPPTSLTFLSQQPRTARCLLRLFAAAFGRLWPVCWPQSHVAGAIYMQFITSTGCSCGSGRFSWLLAQHIISTHCCCCF